MSVMEDKEFPELTKCAMHTDVFTSSVSASPGTDINEKRTIGRKAQSRASEDVRCG